LRDHQIIRLAVSICLAVGAISCRSTATPHVIDSTLASYIPADAVVLAGFDLEKLRTTPLYQSLPPDVLAVAQSLRDASQLIVAYNAHDMLILARGKFREAPPAATLISSELAIAGAPAAVQAARTQHEKGAGGSSSLLAVAERIARSGPVWMAAKGGVTLPLTGNGANVNRILHLTHFVTLVVHFDSQIQIDATGICPTADAGRNLEESLRAIVTLASAAGRRSEFGEALSSIGIRRDDATVHATLSTSPAVFEKLLRGLTR
jgi:hypothetical protein